MENNRDITEIAANTIKSEEDNLKIVSDAIPPYFSFQRNETTDSTGKKIVTITGLGLTLTQNMLPSLDEPVDLVVYGDIITFGSDLNLPGYTCNITINARQIITSNFQIKTSGKDAIIDYSHKEPAKNGTPGIPPSGKGGKGEDGKDAGNGLPGGNITIIAETIKGDLQLTADGGKGGVGQLGGGGGGGTSSYEERTPGGDGGDGGNSGKSGDGGNGGNILVYFINSTNNMSLNSNPGLAGMCCLGGPGGPPGSPGPWYEGPPPVRGKDGASSKPGSDGRPGVRESIQIKHQQIIDTYPSTLAQRLLTLHQAELYYLNNVYDKANELLTWLLNVTPASVTAIAAGPDQSEWVNIHERAKTLLAQLQDGFNYYGDVTNHAPLVSLKYYTEQISSMLILGGQIEQCYDNYQKEESRQADILDSAIGKVQEVITNLNSILNDVKNNKQDLTKTIIELGVEQERQYKIMLQEGKRFESAVMDHTKGCGLSDVLNSIKSFVIFAKDIYDSIQNVAKAVSNLGNTVADFEKAIKSIQPTDGNLENFKESWGQISSVVQTNPDSGKLVTYQEKFDALIAQFTDKYQEARDYAINVHAYMNLIQARNHKVFEYNSACIREAQIKAEIEQKTCEITRIKKQWEEKKDPTLAPMRVFMFGLYNDLKKRLLGYLYQENQAYNYWSLQAQIFSLADNNISQLSEYHTRIQGEIISFMNFSGKPVQPFKTVPSITLTASDLPQQFSNFKASQDPSPKLTFNISKASPVFLGLSHVMATSFTISIPGAKTDNDMLYVLLTHNGRACLMDEEANEKIFSHARVTALYKYVISTGEFIAGGNLSANDNYIGLSPITTWTIIVPRKFNPGLNLDNVSEVIIQFKGQAVPMNDSGTMAMMQKRAL